MQSRLALTAFSFVFFAACGPHDVDLGGGVGGPGEDATGGDGTTTGGGTGGAFGAGGAGGVGGGPTMAGGSGGSGGDPSSTGGVGGSSMTAATGGMPDGSGGIPGGVGGGPAEGFCGNGIVEPPELCDEGMVQVNCPEDCGLSVSMGGAGGGSSTGGVGGVGGSMPDGSGGLGQGATGGGPSMGGMGGTDGSSCFAEVVFETMGACADNDVLLARGYERCAAVGSVLTSIFFAEPCAESQSYSVVIECCPPSGAGGSSTMGGAGGVGGGTMTGGTGGDTMTGGTGGDTMTGGTSNGGAG